jgi:hypothetical protein
MYTPRISVEAIPNASIDLYTTRLSKIAISAIHTVRDEITRQHLFSPLFVPLRVPPT